MSYTQQTSTFNAVMPNIVPEGTQQQNQISSIITDITNIINNLNALNGNGSTGSSWFGSQNTVTGLRSLNTIYQNNNHQVYSHLFSNSKYCISLKVNCFHLKLS